MSTSSTCKNCGKGEVLKACTACKLVKYCNRDCQIVHRPQHKKACRKRAAELHDEMLFKEPPPQGDCPICVIRLPSMGSGRRYMSCYGKILCTGCSYADVYDNHGNIITDANALRSHQAYLNEIKNDQRDKAAALGDDCRYY